MGSRIPFTVTINVPIPDIAPPDIECRVEHTDNYSLNGGELISEIIYITDIKKPIKDLHITIYVGIYYTDCFDFSFSPFYYPYILD